MKNLMNNILLCILFSISLFITIFCLTVLNSNFIIRVIDKTNYVDILYEDIKNQYENLDKKSLYKSIKNYIKSNYDNKYIKYDKKYRDLYNYHVKFNNRFADYDLKLIRMLLFIIDLIFIIITGTIFNKTKGKHDLNKIIIGNFIIGIITFGILKIITKFDFDLFNNVFNSFLHFYFAVCIILFELIIFLNIKKKYLT